MDELTDVLYEVEDGLATITINRPDRLNAFRARTVDELIHCFKRAWASGDVGVVCLTGAGERAFSTGGDQKQRAETGDYGPSESGLFEVETLHRLIREVPKPVIAAVNGYAIGGGHVLHVLCDLTIAADTRGLRPDRSARRLLRRRLRHRATWRASSARSGRARSGSSAAATTPRQPSAGASSTASCPPAELRRRGPPLGRRDPEALPHRAALPQAVVQRRHRAPRRRRAARVHRARPVRRLGGGRGGRARVQPRSASPTSRRFRERVSA